MATTYDLEYKQAGGSVTVVTDIAASEHTITYLTAQQNYEWRVRSVNTDAAGAIYISKWSAWSAFTTLADQVPVPVVLDFVSSSVASTTSNKPVTITVPLAPIVADSWDLEVWDLTTDVVTTYQYLTVSEHILSGLNPANEYSFRVKGWANSRTAEGDWTAWNTFVTDIVPVRKQTTFNFPSTDLDMFSLIVDHFELEGGQLIMHGRASHDANVHFDLEVLELNAYVKAPTWTIERYYNIVPDIIYIEMIDEYNEHDDPSYYLLDGALQETGEDTFIL
jgi:hypothetical protein